MRRFLTIVDAPEKDILLFKSYITLMDGKTDVDWSLRDQGEADAYLVNADSEAGRRFLDTATGARVAYGQAAATYAGDGCWPISLPIRLGALVQALNQAGRWLEGGGEPVATPTLPEAGDSATLAGVLRGLMDAKASQATLAGHGFSVGIDFARGVYWSSEPLDSASCGASGWVVESGSSVPSNDDGDERALARLLWLAGIAEGRVTEGVYRLKRWPDLGALPYRPSFIRLAAMFSRRPSTIAGAAGRTGVPAQEIASFLGGSLLAGYALRLDPVDVPAGFDAGGGEPSKMAGFLGRIRKRLGL